MANIAELAIQVTAKTGGLNKGLKEGRNAISKFAGGVASVTADVAKFGAALATGAAAGIALLTRQSFKALDVIGKVSDKLGFTVDGLRGLRRAAEETGVANQQFDVGLQRLTRRLAEAAQGSGEAQGAIKELGLDAKELAKLPIEEQFLAIADAFESVTGQSDRIRLGFKLFDAEGVALINTLDKGSGALRGFIAEQQRLQGSISRFDVRQVEKANDALADSGKAFRGIFDQIAVSVAPAIQDMGFVLTETFITIREGTADAVSDLAQLPIITEAIITSGAAAQAFFGDLGNSSALLVTAFDLAIKTIGERFKFLFLDQIPNSLANFGRIFGTGILVLVDISKNAFGAIFDIATGVFTSIGDAFRTLTATGDVELALATLGAGHVEAFAGGVLDAVDGLNDDFAKRIADLDRSILENEPKFAASAELDQLEKRFDELTGRFGDGFTDAAEKFREAILNARVDRELEKVFGDLDRAAAGPAGPGKKLSFSRPAALEQGTAAAFSAALRGTGLKGPARLQLKEQQNGNQIMLRTNDLLREIRDDTDENRTVEIRC